MSNRQTQISKKVFHSCIENGMKQADGLKNLGAKPSLYPAIEI
jgi:hypothetical protein